MGRRPITTFSDYQQCAVNCWICLRGESLRTVSTALIPADQPPRQIDWRRRQNVEPLLDTALMMALLKPRPRVWVPKASVYGHVARVAERDGYQRVGVILAMQTDPRAA
jgi:predicted pyridoxine 5'-phosphate oxidase superfamily flavin-nucleotide-binding protein